MITIITNWGIQKLKTNNVSDRYIKICIYIGKTAMGSVSTAYRIWSAVAGQLVFKKNFIIII